MAILFLILFFLLLSAFFSGSEIAFVSASKLGIAVKKDQNTRRGNLIARFYEDPKRFLGTMLVGNNIALVAFTSLATGVLSRQFGDFLGDGPVALLIYTLILTVVVLIVGEFIPKTLFSRYSTSSLFLLAFPLAFFRWLLTVPTFMMTGLSNFLLKRIVDVPDDAVEEALTRVDLEHYIADSLSDEQDDIDKDILTNALNLGHNKVSHCMVPRWHFKELTKRQGRPYVGLIIFSCQQGLVQWALIPIAE